MPNQKAIVAEFTAAIHARRKVLVISDQDGETASAAVAPLDIVPDENKPQKLLIVQGFDGTYNIPLPAVKSVVMLRATFHLRAIKEEFADAGLQFRGSGERMKFPPKTVS